MVCGNVLRASGRVLACAVLVIASALCLDGCVTYATHQIEHPDWSPKTERWADKLAQIYTGFSGQSLHLDSDIDIYFWRVAPGDYGLTEQTKVNKHAGKLVAVEFSMQLGKSFTAAKSAPRGTVILLHGWGLDGASLIPWGVSFAQAGYLALMPDLRGHGRSSRAPVGYGPREAEDIVGWLHALDARKPLPRPITLIGFSYGADVALFAAPQLDDVLRSVIAVEPFADAAAVIEKIPATGLMGHRFIARFMTPGRMRAAVARASKDLDVDLRAVRPDTAVAASPECTLILRGGKDKLVGATDLKKLAGMNPRASYLQVTDADHITMTIDAARLQPPLQRWMQAVDPASDTCPAPPAVAPLASSDSA